MKSKSVESLGGTIARYGLVIVLLWIGGMKFTAYEAEGIKPLVENSPLLSWTYEMVSVQTFSYILGAVEIILAVMIASRPFAPAVCAVGSFLCIGMFVTTLSFLATTPGWEESLGGFPALSVAPGQFVLKDIVNLGVAIWSAGEAWNAKSNDDASTA